MGCGFCPQKKTSVMTILRSEWQWVSFPTVPTLSHTHVLVTCNRWHFLPPANPPPRRRPQRTPPLRWRCPDHARMRSLSSFLRVGPAWEASWCGNKVSSHRHLGGPLPQTAGLPRGDSEAGIYATSKKTFQSYSLQWRVIGHKQKSVMDWRLRAHKWTPPKTRPQGLKRRKATLWTNSHGFTYITR